MRLTTGDSEGFQNAGVSPRCSLNPSSSPVACCRYHPPLISLLALLLNSCCSLHTVAIHFLLDHCFPLSCPSSVHRSHTLLFITHCSGIVAHTMLSTSPSDTPNVVLIVDAPTAPLLPTPRLCFPCSLP
ncbi:hypothetical protein BHE74_00041574 [Ensete ventricosum]|nr:hypothetical protein BHE74_00041574 [Ensete ventricosum]